MNTKEAMDWLFSEEGQREYPDYPERWNAAVRKTLQPLHERAEREGLWFYLYQDDSDDHLIEGEHWWPPSELRAMQDNDELLFWGYAFELRHPNERIEQMQAEINRLQAAIDEWKTEVATRQGRQAPSENPDHRDQRTMSLRD